MRAPYMGGPTPRQTLGDDLVKSARIELLLASTALGLGLVLCAQPGMAQQSDKQIQVSVSTPDVALPPPAAKDVAAAPADTTKAEPDKADTAKA